MVTVRVDEGCLGRGGRFEDPNGAGRPAGQSARVADHAPRRGVFGVKWQQANGDGGGGAGGRIRGTTQAPVVGVEDKRGVNRQRKRHGEVRRALERKRGVLGAVSEDGLKTARPVDGPQQRREVTMLACATRGLLLLVGLCLAELELHAHRDVVARDWSCGGREARQSRGA